MPDAILAAICDSSSRSCPQGPDVLTKCRFHPTGATTRSSVSPLITAVPGPAALADRIGTNPENAGALLLSRVADGDTDRRPQQIGLGPSFGTASHWLPDREGGRRAGRRPHLSIVRDFQW